MDTMNHFISTQSLIWLFLVIFILHDMEEIIWVEHWMRQNKDHLQQFLPKKMLAELSSMLDITSSQFAVAVLIEFLVLVPCTFLAAEQGIFLMFLGVNTLMFFHVFTHVGHSLILKRYTPGVISAVLLVLPYSIYLFMRLTDEGWVCWEQIFDSIPLGFILVPIVLLGHKAGKKIVPASSNS